MTRRAKKFKSGASRALAFWAIAFILLPWRLGSPSPAAGAQKKHLPEKPIDLNTATADQLQQLPAVGPSMAKAIVTFREKSGPFRRVEDLLAIRGITKERLEKIRPYVKIVPPDSKPQASPPGDSG